MGWKEEKGKEKRVGEDRRGEWMDEIDVTRFRRGLHLSLVLRAIG